MIYSVDIVTRMQDNGDGGYTIYGYNTEEEMLADHPLARKGYGANRVKVELTEKQKRDILTEDDPNSLSFDVGMDCHNLMPLSFNEVEEILSKKIHKPVDHHM